MRRHAAALALALVFAAPAAHAQRADTARTKAWLLAVDRALASAIQEHGAAALVEALAHDAAVLVPGEAIALGHDAEPAIMARYGRGAKLGWRPLAAVASTEPTFGCTVGITTWTPSGDSTNRERPGNYLACWRRAPNGVPHLVGLQFNHGAPGTPLPPATFDGGAMPHSATTRSRALREAQDADSAFAAAGGTSAGPAEAFAAWVADDGLFPGEAGPLRGPALVRATFGPPPGARILTWAPTRTLGVAAGGLAFTVGEATSRPMTGDGPVARTKYLTVWRQEADGRWRWIFDLGSPRP